MPSLSPRVPPQFFLPTTCSADKIASGVNFYAENFEGYASIW